MDSGNAIMYPLITETTLMRGIEAFERTTLAPGCLDRPIVRAAGILRKDSATEIVDVNKLSQKSTSVIQYVEVADANGHLYCVDGDVNTSCWLKIVSFAKDCQSCNVILALSDKGVILRATRCITPGEPLLMWFTESILAMLNIPFLTPANIQGQNRYICHVCNDLFEYPNPLKIHLALKCNRLDSNHFWTSLATEFGSPHRSSLSFSLFPQPTFSFQLRKSPEPPILRDSNVPVTNGNSSHSSDQVSPSSSNQISPNSTPKLISSNSSNPPIVKDLNLIRQSAFKPYANQEPVLRTYTIPPTAPAPIADVHAAQVETIVSNLGKTKRGHLCIYCGKVYSRKYGLKIHIRTHTGYKPLKCKYCLRPFGDPSNLNKHVRLHADGETPYRCDLCGKIMVRRRDLERHIRSRHQENGDNITDSSSDGTDT
ncbi:transcription factor hamlet-like [Ceratina calcarata]|uniref:Transcription factor hamlet-like n=1 Tax=Ceratina calcarata TaxID=156304 RepID=A0AAJ7IT30_9HYME|nr:transcription factor hamlet-like [Ceratina calcarata]